MKYEELTAQQKAIFDRVDKIYHSYHSINRVDFVTVLGILINKYKFKKSEEY